MMKTFRTLRMAGLFSLATAFSVAEEATAIIRATADNYLQAQSAIMHVDTRVLDFSFAAVSAPGRTSAPSLESTHYRRLILKVRRPQAYYLAMQTWRAGAPRGADMMQDLTRGAGLPPSAQSSWSVLARSDETGGKQGFYVGGQFRLQDIPAARFDEMANARLGPNSAKDMVLQYFRAGTNASSAENPLGLVEADLLGRESLLGQPVCRIVGKTAEGYSVTVWIDERTSMVMRSVVQRPWPTGRRVTVEESLYRNQTVNRPLSGSEFLVDSPPPGGQPEGAEMGFTDVATLVAQAAIGLPGEGASAGEKEEEVAAAPKPDAAPAAATPAAANAGQALSPEQMAAIVLIEGDAGTATGFITKIRGVDFVVTNLHVLGGNKKISLKTLRGDELTIQGIFGAVGSDIAIIRIAGGRSGLQLAGDLFESAKIGDRIVVVGNRLGGGVATQTPGSVVGLGPTRVEVNANFESGNSGSPIVNLGTGEVIGVASYSETRRVPIEDGASSSTRAGGEEVSVHVEKRWFGFRVDSVTKWEAIDLGRWNAQMERLQRFRETSEALVAVIRFNFRDARQHARLTSILDGFESRYRASASNSLSAATEVKDLFRVIRTISNDGMRELETGDYYDYFRTCLYWENSIPAQLEYRKAIIEVLKKYEANSTQYLSRMRG